METDMMKTRRLRDRETKVYSYRAMEIMIALFVVMFLIVILACVFLAARNDSSPEAKYEFGRYTVHNAATNTDVFVVDGNCKTAVVPHGVLTVNQDVIVCREAEDDITLYRENASDDITVKYESLTTSLDGTVQSKVLVDRTKED